MQQCSIYDRSLKFSRFIYGAIVLIAILVHSKWLVLAVSILTILGAFSLNLNIPYQLHIFTERILLKKNIKPSKKEFGELSFVSAATGILLLIGFLLLQFTVYSTFAWIYLLVVTLMIFLACLVGFCVATLMYVILKSFLFKNKTKS